MLDDRVLDGRFLDAASSCSIAVRVDIMRWLRDWSPRRLVVSWIGYWIALLAALVGPAIPAIWRATHAPAGQGNLSLSFGNGAFTLSVSLSGSETWSGSIGYIA